MRLDGTLKSNYCVEVAAAVDGSIGHDSEATVRSVLELKIGLKEDTVLENVLDSTSCCPMTVPAMIADYFGRSALVVARVSLGKKD